MQQNIRQEQEALFKEELARLNPAQREAVAHTEGPVMVLAGPGTGKTHLLAARIGNILLKTDAGAHNILCLTFTEAGVKAMRERLLSFIGPEAHRVAIHTFHGFCSRVIQDNLQYFGRPGLEPLSELERIRIIRELLDQQLPDSPLRKGSHDPYRYEDHLQNLFAAMKSEHWEEDQLLQLTDRYVTELPTTDGFFYKNNRRGAYAKGDPREGKIEEETLHMNRLKAGVKLFPAYQEALRQQKRYDYGDMIGWVLRAFHDFPSLLKSYQERFQYLLIDEFQDTNGSQNEIVRMLADYWERPNIFIVGDDDQAIYEFQGARLRGMQEFFNRYDEVKLIALTENYRSTQPILDLAGRLISHNERRIGSQLPELGIDKRLSSAGQHEEVTASVRPLRFPDQRQERGAIVQALREWNEAGTPWEEMAIIYAKNKQAEPLRYLLERAGIPYRSKRRPNVLDAGPIRQLRELLRYLQLEFERPGSGDHLLYRVLHLDTFGIPAADLAHLNVARVNKEDQRPSLRTFLLSPADWPTTINTAEAIERTAVFLESMVLAVPNLPLQELVERAVNESGLLRRALDHPDRLLQLQYLTTFSDFVLEELARRPRLDLRSLLLTLDQMDANRVALPLRSHLDQANAVLLVTAHSAKGLEFEKVWILDAAEGSWGGAKRRGNGNFRLPATLTYSGTEDEEEARRRLFFVALTRARSEVTIGFSETDQRGRPQQQVQFIDEVFSGTELDFEDYALPVEVQVELSTLQLEPKDEALFPELEDSLIDGLLTDFRLSVSSLYAYLDCPARFYYEKLLRVPDRERDQATYGIALHQALQDYFNRMLKNPSRAFPSKEELLYYFEVAISRSRGLLTRSVYQRFLESGKRELAAYYQRYRSSWVTSTQVERYFGHTEVDGVPLVGMIDRIDDVSDAFAKVVDYKTSAAGADKLRPPTKAKPYGGDYWRQLTFYKLLYDNAPGQIRRVERGQISHLLTNAAGEQPIRTIELSRKDTDKLRVILKEMWEQIQEKNFGGCGKEECEWCAFLAGRKRMVPTDDHTAELLDDKS